MTDKEFEATIILRDAWEKAYKLTGSAYHSYMVSEYKYRVRKERNRRIQLAGKK